MPIRSFRHTALCSATAATLAFAAPLAVCAQEATYHFDIPAQELGAALRAFAQASRQQITFDNAVVQGRTSVALEGRYTVDEGLRRLLKGSGLELRRTPNGVLYVVDPAALPAVEAGAVPSEESAVIPRTAPANTAVQELDKIIVTGTYIRGGVPVGSPLTIVTRGDIEQSGAGSVAELVQKLPQNTSQITATSFLNSVNGTGEGATNSGLGTAIGLRGLGAGATLVLVNGRRIAPAGTKGASADVSMIPLAMIDRIEILGDGASSTYGSDAIGGVVNFILRKDFDGAETAVRYGSASHDDAREVTASQAVGTYTGRGHASLSYEYHDRNALAAADRPFVPEQPFPVDIMPAQQRHSLFFSGGHDFGESGSFEANALYSRRRFGQDYFSVFSFVPSSDRGTVQQFMVDGVLRQEFGGWEASIGASHARFSEDRTSSVGEEVFRVQTRSTEQGANARVEGAVVDLPAGEARLALGSDFRKESLRPLGRTEGDLEFERRIYSAFGELFVPLFGDRNARPLLHELSVSLALRYDRYEGYGGSTSPKFGIEWAPNEHLSFRSSYSTSFHAPLLIDLIPLTQTYFAFQFPNPASPTGQTNTLVKSFSANPGLTPERARSFTAGVDFHPRQLPGLKASLTYFDVRFKDRIAFPPVAGSVFDVFSQLDVLGPIVDLDPDPAEVAEIFANNAVLDLSGLGPDGVEAIFDASPQNIGSTRSRGVELSLQNRFRRGDTDLWLQLSANRFIELGSRLTPTSSPIEISGTVFNPPRFKARAGAGFAHGNFFGSLHLNYTDDYANTLVQPEARVSSWLTGDVQLGWASERTTLTFNVDNLTDRDPPGLRVDDPMAYNLGYDGANASPRGRFVSFSIRQSW